MKTFDFSKPETQALYEAEVRKRVELFGMSREQAEMLVAVLMWKGPAPAQDDDGGKR
jgi:hypothetical protein